LASHEEYLKLIGEERLNQLIDEREMRE
jgi:hypothetical protein